MNKTLGVALIVKNEAEVIRACLDSIKGADEIYIADTGSTDDTVNICKKYTKHVYHFKWCDDFAAARNFILDKCDTDVVFSIDADEVLLTPVEKIKALINSYDFQKYLGATVETQTDIERLTQVRIFKNMEEIKWQGVIHELITYNGKMFKNRCIRTAFELKSGYSPAHKSDPDRNMRILLDQLSKDENDTRSMYYLAREYINRQDIDTAIVWLNKYFQITYYKDWTNELADACYLLALCYMDKGNVKMALSAAATAVLVMPTYKAPMTLLHNLFKPFYPLASAFWLDLSKRANNAGILFNRETAENKNTSKSLIIKP